jgi:DNA-binding CsgD family transcriptional regulator
MATPFLNPPDLFQDRGVQFYIEHYPKYPLAAIQSRTSSSEVVKISDLFTTHAWQRAEFYNEVFRPVRLWDQIMLSLGPPKAPIMDKAIALNRAKPFTERDRSILHLLRPHLRQALLNAQAITRMQKELDIIRQAVEAVDRGIAVLAESGRIGLITSKARQLVTEYFAAPRADRLPEALDSWARYQKSLLAEKDDIPASTKPLVVARDEKKLVVRLVPNGSGHVLLLEERQSETSLELAQERWELTKREAEVLYWVAQGKTNIEIGTILATRPKTVEKHLERVYQKMGVENRTAAVRQVLETQP